MTKVIVVILFVVVVFAGYLFLDRKTVSSKKAVTDQTNLEENGIISDPSGLSIEKLREGSYPGSEMVIEENLAPGSNYKRYIASYKSEGLKIFGLLTVPDGPIPQTDGKQTGWPVIIFNHGYINPSEYRTTERYIAYTDGFSRNGYVVFKPDYRGHGSSEGDAAGGYGSNAYTIDVLNALASVKKLKDPESGTGPVADGKRIGMWGHSMGGFITLRSMVVSKDIKAGVIWGGVVASYPDLLTNWRRGTFTPPPGIPSRALSWRNRLTALYGSPEKNPGFWNSISANSFLKDISGPIELHHGTADTSVPILFSEKLENQLKQAGKTVEFYKYEGDDHNITANFNMAIRRSVEFFDKYLK